MQISIKNSIYRLSLLILWIMALFYVMLLFTVWNLETNMTFPAIGYSKINVLWDQIFLMSPQWLKVSCLFRDTKSKKTIIYFHGNGGDINIFDDEIDYISSLWFNVLAVDFPWYGESGEIPTESSVYSASQTAYNYLTWTKKINSDNIIIWWYSIGTAAATDLAYHNPVYKLVLVAPLTSRYDMSTKLLWFPLQKYLFQKDSFVSIDKIKTIKIPTLIIHGTNDSIIPFEMWEKLFENSPAIQKKFIPINWADHNGILDIYGDELRDIFKEFLE